MLSDKHVTSGATLLQGAAHQTGSHWPYSTMRKRRRQLITGN